MNKLSGNVTNPSLLKKTKDFIQFALTFLEPRAGTEIIEFIKKKPETERNRYYRLLNPHPEFYALILHYEEALKQFSEFSDFDRIMHEDTILSKHVDTLISNGMSGARMESSMYLFFILDKLIVSYFLSGNRFDEELFDNLYRDMEYLFYNDDLPFKVIAPLHNFGSEIGTIDLGEGLIIRKITAEERKIFSRLVEDLSLNWAQIAELEYTIEYPFTEKKTLGDSVRVSVDEKATNLLMKLVTIMRLFKEGSVGFSYAIWKPTLQTALKGGGISSSFPAEITYGPKYELNEKEVSYIQEFWRMTKWDSLEGTGNKNLDLALRRFNSAYTRASNEDKLIDYAIAYKALFSMSNDTHDSVTHKLALRFTRLVGKDYNERKDTFRTIKELYGERSKVVHGDPAPVTKVGEMERYVRRAITAYLDRFSNNVSHDDIINKLDLD